MKIERVVDDECSTCVKLNLTCVGSPDEVCTGKVEYVIEEKECEEDLEVV